MIIIILCILSIAKGQSNLVGEEGIPNPNIPACTGANADGLQRDCAIYQECANYASREINQVCIKCGNDQYSITRLNTATTNCQNCKIFVNFIDEVNVRQTTFRGVCGATIQRAQESSGTGGSESESGGGSFATSSGACACTRKCRRYTLSPSRCPTTQKSCVVSNSCPNGRQTGRNKYLCCG